MKKNKEKLNLLQQLTQERENIKLMWAP